MARFVRQGAYLQYVRGFPHRHLVVLRSIAQDLQLDSCPISWDQLCEIDSDLSLINGQSLSVDGPKVEAVQKRLQAISDSAESLSSALVIKSGWTEMSDVDFKARGELFGWMKQNPGISQLVKNEQLLSEFVEFLSHVQHAAEMARHSLKPLPPIGPATGAEKSEHRRPSGPRQNSQLVSSGAPSKTDCRKLLLETCLKACIWANVEPKLSSKEPEGANEYRGNLFVVYKHFERLLPAKLRFRAPASRYNFLKRNRPKLQQGQKPASEK